MCVVPYGFNCSLKTPRQVQTEQFEFSVCQLFINLHLGIGIEWIGRDPFTMTNLRKDVRGPESPWSIGSVGKFDGH